MNIINKTSFLPTIVIILSCLPIHAKNPGENYLQSFISEPTVINDAYPKETGDSMKRILLDNDSVDSMIWQMVTPPLDNKINEFYINDRIEVNGQTCYLISTESHSDDWTRTDEYLCLFNKEQGFPQLLHIAQRDINGDRTFNKMMYSIGFDYIKIWRFNYSWEFSFIKRETHKPTPDGFKFIENF